MYMNTSRIDCFIPTPIDVDMSKLSMHGSTFFYKQIDSLLVVVGNGWCMRGFKP